MMPYTAYSSLSLKLQLGYLAEILREGAENNLHLTACMGHLPFYYSGGWYNYSGWVNNLKQHLWSKEGWWDYISHVTEFQHLCKMTHNILLLYCTRNQGSPATILFHVATKLAISQRQLSGWILQRIIIIILKNFNLTFSLYSDGQSGCSDYSPSWNSDTCAVHHQLCTVEEVDYHGVATVFLIWVVVYVLQTEELETR